MKSYPEFNSEHFSYSSFSLIMRCQGGTKKVSFLSVGGRPPRFLFFVGMSEYAPKLISDF